MPASGWTLRGPVPVDEVFDDGYWLEFARTARAHADYSGMWSTALTRPCAMWPQCPHQGQRGVLLDELWTMDGPFSPMT